MRKADNLSPSCLVVKKSGKGNFLERSGLVQACNGTELSFTLQWYLERKMRVGRNSTEIQKEANNIRLISEKKK